MNKSNSIYKQSKEQQHYDTLSRQSPTFTTLNSHRMPNNKNNHNNNTEDMDSSMSISVSEHKNDADAYASDLGAHVQVWVELKNDPTGTSMCIPTRGLKMSNL
jgi:hypothetical protein